MIEVIVQSKAECLDCLHVWEAVHPLAADDLECPNCYSKNTIRVDPSWN